MIPSKLNLQNFCAHENSTIDFDKFSSAVIVGQINGNDFISNGAGKSTIFNAIKYVLFGESDFPLDELIRDGTSQCEVSLEFFIDSQKYKVKRSRNKKNSSTLIKLEKLVGTSWQDISQKTPSATELELAKLIKINWKTFYNSKIIVQNDLSGLPTLAPEKRKLLFRELLDLNTYSKYEVFAKKKLADIVNNVNEIDIQIKTLSSQKIDIPSLEKELLEKKSELSINELALNNFKLKDSSLSNEIDTLKKQLLAHTDLVSKRIILEKELTNLQKDKNQLSIKIPNLINETTNLKQSVTNLKTKLNTLSNKKEPDQKEISKIQQEISNLKALQISLKKEKEKLASKTLHVGECPTCEQEITDMYIDLIENKNNNSITKINVEMEQNTKTFNDLNSKLKLLEEDFRNWQNAKHEEKNLLVKLETDKKILLNQSSILDDANHKLSAISKEINDKQKELDKLTVLNEEAAYAKLAELNTSKKVIENEITNTTSLIVNLQKYIATREHILESSKKLEEQIKILHDKKQDAGKLIPKYNLACQAFGSSGIPAQLTNSILDEVQLRSNEFLDELRPGLQLQFSISKSKKGKEDEDTLDIQYVIDGKPRTYSQLSGAQKVCISVSLKLGIAAFIKAQMGSDFNLLLLDEADQALDKKSLDTYIDMVKTLSKKFKVLVITHNDFVKDSFHNIIVKQDSNGTSSIQ